MPSGRQPASCFGPSGSSMCSAVRPRPTVTAAWPTRCASRPPTAPSPTPTSPRSASRSSTTSSRPSPPPSAADHTAAELPPPPPPRSEEQTYELHSLMRTPYTLFYLQKKHYLLTLATQHYYL